MQSRSNDSGKKSSQSSDAPSEEDCIKKVKKLLDFNNDGSEVAVLTAQLMRLTMANLNLMNKNHQIRE